MLEASWEVGEGRSRERNVAAGRGMGDVNESCDHARAFLRAALRTVATYRCQSRPC